MTFVAKVETFEGSGPQPFYFRLRAGNGEIVAASEGYERAHDRDRSALALGQQLGVPVEPEVTVP